MKRFVVAIALFVVPSFANAGVSYSFVSTTTGASPQTLRGSVFADAGKVRIDIAAGDDLIFRSGTYVVTTDEGRSLRVVDPSARTYYMLDAQNLFGAAGGALSQLRGLVDFKVKNARAKVRDAGAGPAISGYPTRQASIDTSYDLVMNLFGESTTVPIRMRTDLWSTDRIPASAAGLLDLRGIRTGIDAVDKLLTSQTGGVSGFPLKQITTVDVVLNGRTSRSTTTTTVKDLKQASVAPEMFAIPAGYTRVASPIESLLQQFGMR